MTQEELLTIFRTAGALLEGHFLLTSGLHSPQYFQCARVLQYPELANKLSQELARQYSGFKPDVVASPALGGIIVGHEVARALGCRSIFAEREAGAMTLRRGFAIEPGEKVLVVEDVVTTGGSVHEVMNLVTERGGELIGAGFLVDRSGGQVKFSVPMRSLLKLKVVTYKPEQCPLCEKKLPLVKPGSRNIKI